MDSNNPLNSPWIKSYATDFCVVTVLFPRVTEVAKLTEHKQTSLRADLNVKQWNIKWLSAEI